MSQPDRNIRLSVSFNELDNGRRFQTGVHYTVTVNTMGVVFVRIMDATGRNPLVNRPYRIIDVAGADIEGTTDADGLLRHEEIPTGYYTLSIDDEEATVFTDTDPSDPVIVRMLWTDARDE